MKKRLLAVVLCVAMLSMTACGTEDVMKTMGLGGKKNASVEETDAQEGTAMTESVEETATVEPVSGVVLGGDFDESEADFEYLYAETLMTESTQNAETGKMENQKLTVFLPQGDYNTVNRDYARAERLGLELYVCLNPQIQYHQEDYTVEENLESYLEYEYDEFYSVDYRDLTISEVESDGVSARASVEYLYYDSWDKEYYPVFCTYYLKELDKNTSVLVSTEINATEATGKTPLLVEELESFYGFEIDWDADAAQAKLDAFLASGEKDVVTVSTGYLKFELPQGWEEDYNADDDYSTSVYAPGGDTDTADCFISIGRSYEGEDASITEFLKDDTGSEFLKQYFTQLGLDADNVTVENYGLTCLGETLRCKFVLDMYGVTATVDCYIACMDGYTYQLFSVQTADSEEDASAILQQILAEGQVRGQKNS